MIDDLRATRSESESTDEIMQMTGDWKSRRLSRNRTRGVRYFRDGQSRTWTDPRETESKIRISYRLPRRSSRDSSLAFENWHSRKWKRGSFRQVIGSSNAITNHDQYHTFKWIRHWRGSCVTFEDGSILWPTIRRHDTNRDLLSKHRRRMRRRTDK